MYTTTKNEVNVNSQILDSKEQTSLKQQKKIVCYRFFLLLCCVFFKTTKKYK